MTKLQSLRITIAVDKIIEGLNVLKNAVEMLVPAEEPKSPADTLPTEFESSGPQTKPVQLKLPLPPVTASRAARQRLGDVGYENEVNPNRQTCGQLGGLATAGIKRAPCPDRRPRGSVMIKNMSVNEKRRYWRWSKYRAAQRSAGLEPVSWAAWTDGAGS